MKLKFIYKHKNKLCTAKVDSIYDLNYQELKKKGIKLLIFDVDDTLTGHHQQLSEKVLDLLTELSQSFKVALFSNCRRKRWNYLVEMMKNLPILVEKSTPKPHLKGFKDILKHFQLNPKETVMIGDRIGTDLWGAYLAGIKGRILVEPVSNQAPFYIKSMRYLEKKLF